MAIKGVGDGSGEIANLNTVPEHGQIGSSGAAGAKPAHEQSHQVTTGFSGVDTKTLAPDAGMKPRFGGGLFGANATTTTSNIPSAKTSRSADGEMHQNITNILDDMTSLFENLLKHKKQ